MADNGHGLTWAAVPWAGHYTVAPPIWVSAHYTQATSYGWHFMPVGSGSGMLPAGGSYVSLVSPNGCTESAQARINGQKLGEEAVGTAVDFTMVLQTMEYTMSKCFKDTHAPFTVSSQVRFGHATPSQMLFVSLLACCLSECVVYHSAVASFQATSCWWRWERVALCSAYSTVLRQHSRSCVLGTA
jgi:hypothetical protein